MAMPTVSLRQLLEAGMRRESIRILVATGLHRPNEGEELAELIGDQWVLDNFRVENHFARNDADHVDLGDPSETAPDPAVLLRIADALERLAPPRAPDWNENAADA